MKKIIILAMGIMFLFVGNVGVLSARVVQPARDPNCFIYGDDNCVCGGAEYPSQNKAFVECIKREIEEGKKRELERVEKAEERAEQAKKEEEAKIRAIVKEELGYSDLAKDSQKLIKENTLLKIDNARLERDNFDLGKRVFVLEGLIERQMKIIDLFKVLLGKLKLL
jgi:hypothetical protein